MAIATADLYSLETVAVALVSDVDAERIVRGEAAAFADACRRCGQTEPPPVVVFRKITREGGRVVESLRLYDGRKRIAAARAKGIETIPAAVCKSRTHAERLRLRIQQAGGAIKFWNAQRSPTPDP